MRDDGENEGDLTEKDLPAEADMDDGDEDDSDLDNCPKCRKPIFEDAEWCHYCGNYISRESPQPSRAFWIVVIVAALVIAGILFQFRF